MKAKRLYKGSDSKMIEHVLGMRALFQKHQADFTAFDPSLDAGFLTAWQTTQENVISTEDDKYVVSDGEILLEEAVSALEKCQLKYIDVKYYAGKAFPGNKELLKEFGEGQYSKVRNSPLRMVQFMEGLFGVATKYKTELIAKNYTQAAIDEIDTLTADLRADNKNQQLKKKERPTLTRSRIELLNTYYSFGQQVAAVAPLVYRHSPAHRNMFLLAQRHHPKLVKSWITLPASAVRKTSLTKLLKKFDVTITNQSKETIEYWRANNINESPAEKYPLEPGEVLTIKTEEPVKKFFVMQNSNAKAVRIMMTKEKK